MKTRMIILMLVAMLALGLTASVAASGPPWPAEVYTPKEGICWVPWVAWEEGEQNIVWLVGTGSYVYEPRTGVWNTTCSTSIDFDDPSMATIQEVCAAFSELASCSPSTFKVIDILACENEYNITTDSLYVVNPSGQAKLVCHFNPAQTTEP